MISLLKRLFRRRKPIVKQPAIDPAVLAEQKRQYLLPLQGRKAPADRRIR